MLLCTLIENGDCTLFHLYINSVMSPRCAINASIYWLPVTAACNICSGCSSVLCHSVPLALYQEWQKSCQINLKVCLEILWNTGHSEVLFFLCVLERKGNVPLHEGSEVPLCSAPKQCALLCWSASCQSFVCVDFYFAEVFCRVFTANTDLCCSATVLRLLSLVCSSSVHSCVLLLSCSQETKLR